MADGNCKHSDWSLVRYVHRWVYLIKVRGCIAWLLLIIESQLPKVYAQFGSNSLGNKSLWNAASHQSKRDCMVDWWLEPIEINCWFGEATAKADIENVCHAVAVLDPKFVSATHVIFISVFLQMWIWQESPDHQIVTCLDMQCLDM